MKPSGFPALLQRFFTERLIAQQGASPHTVAGYRDTFRLLLQFAKDRLGREPSALRIEELDTQFLEAFSNTWNLIEETGHGRETIASRLSMPSFDTSRLQSRRSACSVSAFSPYPRSASRGDPWSSSLRKRLPHSCRLRTSGRGSAGGIVRSCGQRFKRPWQSVPQTRCAGGPQPARQAGLGQRPGL